MDVRNFVQEIMSQLSPFLSAGQNVDFTLYVGWGRLTGKDELAPVVGMGENKVKFTVSSDAAIQREQGI